MHGSRRGVRPMGHGVNIVTLSEETERNREYKATPKVSKAHIYSTKYSAGNRALNALGCTF